MGTEAVKGTVERKGSGGWSSGEKGEGWKEQWRERDGVDGERKREI